MNRTKNLSIQMFVVLVMVALLTQSATATMITYLGYDSTTGADWRTTSVAKPAAFDPSGDDAYGTDGYFIFYGTDGSLYTGDNGAMHGSPIAISSLPNYIGSVEIGSSINYQVSSYGLPALDDPSQPIGATVTNFDKTNWAFATTSANDVYDNFFTITLAQDATFVLNVITGTDNAPYYNGANGVMVTSGSVSAGSGSLISGHDGSPDHTFFQLSGQQGDTFTVACMANSGVPATSGIGFETVTSPQAVEGLSRGHNILLQRGLQLQALSFLAINPPATGIFNSSTWDQSNFTTVHLWHGSYTSTPMVFGYPADRMPTAPGPAWGMTDYGKPGDIDISATPYASQLVSYQYGDEQDISTAAEMATLQQAMALMHINQPNVITYTNQWGTQISSANLQTYMQQVQPDMLCFDTYPFKGNVAGGSPTNFYRDMQKYRLLGLAGNDGTGTQPIPVALYTQTVTYSGVNNHIVSESEIRLNNFSAWAFGYKFVDSFVYEASDADSGITPVLFSGGGTANPTAQFYQVAETNRQSLNLGPALVRLISTSVQIKLGQHEETGTYWWGGHYTETVTNDTPTGVPQWSTGIVPYITGISVTNVGSKNDGLQGDVIIGCFKPLDASLTNVGYENDPYFMIVNGLSDGSGSAADCRQQIHLDFDFYTSGISSLLRLSRETGLVEMVPLTHNGGTQYSLDFFLDGGTGDLFKFSNGGVFVGTYVPSVPNIPGDANGDGRVDGSDVTILAGNWQVLSGATWAMGDFNGDGRVDGSDVTILAGNWQAGVMTTAASVPEPGMLALLLGCVLSMNASRKNRKTY